MAKLSNPYTLIPLFLNVILLMGIPAMLTGGENLARVAPLLLLAFVTPWFLAFVIGRIVERVAEDQAKHRDAADNSDFV